MGNTYTDDADDDADDDDDDVKMGEKKVRR